VTQVEVTGETGLSRQGRELYVQEIVTLPALPGWEASFDGGETWVTGEGVDGQDDQWQWLVHGPDFDPENPLFPDAESTPITASRTYPLLRAVGNPEVIVAGGSAIQLTD
jgi:hypothetical protein